MSAPRIGVRKIRGLWVWSCTGEIADYHHGGYLYPEWAADAGRAHIRQAHAANRLLDLTLEVKAGTYCRAHGCQCDECGCGLTGPHSTREAPSTQAA